MFGIGSYSEELRKRLCAFVDVPPKKDGYRSDTPDLAQTQIASESCLMLAA